MTICCFSWFWLDCVCLNTVQTSLPHLGGQKVESRGTCKAVLCLTRAGLVIDLQYNTAGPKNPPSNSICFEWGENTLKMHFYAENMSRTNWTNKLKHPRRPTTEGSEQNAATRAAQPQMQILALARPSSKLSPQFSMFRFFSRTKRGYQNRKDAVWDLGLELSNNGRKSVLIRQCFGKHLSLIQIQSENPLGGECSPVTCS